MSYKRERLQVFLKIARIFVTLSFALLFTASMVYLYVNEATYHLIVLFIIAVLVAVILFAGFIIYIVSSAYKSRKINKAFAQIVNRFVKIVIPIAVELVGLFKMDKNVIRGFFVDINNIIVASMKPKCTNEKVLILVPHCLQWAGCGYKITNNPKNCRRCGKCNIDAIVGLAEKYRINLCIASGGTMARKAIQEYKPEVIISVACNRDLISGILDVERIPVIAIENTTPEGPCINTKVDVHEIQKQIKKVLK